MAKSGQEVVYEGWLTKSPPTKRIWRARWRRRWFSLKHSGDIPNQFILTYYADRNCRKLKGFINLDDCEQVDLGLKLEEKKLKLDHVFDIKTPTRTYYLAADSESEMKSWVNCICKVCGLKATSDEEDLHNPAVDVDYCEEKNDEAVVVVVTSTNDTPPVSPVSTSPYIPISECITGKSPVFNSQDFKSLIKEQMKNLSKSDYNNETHSNQTYGVSQRNYLNYVNDIPNNIDPRFYDSPRVLQPVPKKPTTIDIGNNNNNYNNINNSSNSDNNKIKRERNNSSPLQSPTDTDSAFTDDDNNCDNIDVFVTQKFVKNNLIKNVNNSGTIVPPRPPKTLHTVPGSNAYINLNVQSPTMKTEDVKDVTNDKNHQNSQKIITDDMYDFPRSHQVESETLRNLLPRRHCYNNAAPVKIEGQIFRYDISPGPSTSNNQVFRYDLEDVQDEPASPLSQCSSTTGYSNLPSPLSGDHNNQHHQIMPPPIVNRDLKPKRKLSDSLSLSSNPEPQSPRNNNNNNGGPSVDRKLKPPTPLQDVRKLTKPTLSPTITTTTTTSIQIQKNLSCFHENDGNRQIFKTMTLPSPTLIGLTRSYESLLSQNDQQEQIYHYLPGKMQYLDLDLDCGGSSNLTNTTTNTLPSKSSGGNTVYKKVDFEKTQAFNITRNNLEKERKEPMTFLKK